MKHLRLIGSKGDGSLNVKAIVTLKDDGDCPNTYRAITSLIREDRKYLEVIPLVQIFTSSPSEGDEQVKSNTSWTVNINDLL